MAGARYEVKKHTVLRHLRFFASLQTKNFKLGLWDSSFRFNLFGDI